jgi:hypothetical protein
MTNPSAMKPGLKTADCELTSMMRSHVFGDCDRMPEETPAKLEIL